MSKIDRIRAKLLKRNVILLYGDVSGSTVVYVNKCLSVFEACGSPDIEVRILTGGGDVKEGLDIYASLFRYGGKKTGTVYTHAMSMGAIILQACDERVCLPSAIILIHRAKVSVTLDAIENPERLDRLRFLLRSCDDVFSKILTQRTNKSEEEIFAACKKNQNMTAQEALAFGLIDRIKGE